VVARPELGGGSGAYLCIYLFLDEQRCHFELQREILLDFLAVLVRSTACGLRKDFSLVEMTEYYKERSRKSDLPEAKMSQVRAKGERLSKRRALRSDRDLNGTSRCRCVQDI